MKGGKWGDVNGGAELRRSDTVRKWERGKGAHGEESEGAM